MKSEFYKVIISLAYLRCFKETVNYKIPIILLYQGTDYQKTVMVDQQDVNTNKASPWEIGKDMKSGTKQIKGNLQSSKWKFELKKLILRCYF